MNEDVFVSQIALRDTVPSDSYLADLPVIRHLQKMGKLQFRKPVTFLVGENGIGKSTLIEAIAVSMGFNPEGGTLNFNFSTRDSHSELCHYLSVGKTPKRRRDGFFLRAESFYNVASYIDDLDVGGDLTRYYGGKSLHRQSHGESFLALVENRFGGNGIYILDEPEAALSPARLMRLMVAMQELVKKNSQFIISTHSPVLMTFPNAEIYQLTEEGIASVTYDQTEHFQLTKRFMETPDRMLRYLFDEV